MAERSQRAARYSLPLPLRWRVLGSPEWSSGETRNISGSGVLFVADREYVAGTQVELRMPLEVGGRRYAGEIAARGRIVRTAPATTTMSGPAIAAKFEEYKIVPQSFGEPE
jgi:hypothetical protein